MTAEHVVLSSVAGVTIILAVSSALTMACRQIRLPVVVGQILAGIMLGPSGLGQISESLPELLFPPQVRPVLSAAAQFGVVLFLFTVGYELDLSALRRWQRTILSVSAGALVIPMLAGVSLGLVLMGNDSARSAGSNTTAFVLFCGVALTITAVPVLAAILSELRLMWTLAGVVALASASTIDVVGWLALTAVVAANGGQAVSVGWAFGVLIYLGVMVAVIRPLLRLWSRHKGGSLGQQQVLAIVALAMASAWMTGWLGLHLIFGAILFGAIMPRRDDGRPDPTILTPLVHTSQFLLPLFFFVSGLSVDLTAVGDAGVSLMIAAFLLAVASKVGGGMLSARLAGLHWRDATLVGVLLNTRGLTELVVLNVGLQAHLISTQLFSILTVMALLTTAMTGPLAHAIFSKRGGVGLVPALPHQPQQMPGLAQLATGTGVTPKPTKPSGAITPKELVDEHQPVETS